MADVIATDKTNPPTPMQEAVHSWPMYRAMVGLGILCGLLIVVVYLATGSIIQRKQAAHLERAVLNVLPGASYKINFAKTADGAYEPADGSRGGKLYYAGYDAQGELVGIAIEAQGMGYADIIRVLYGYDPVNQKIIGMQVLASKETPGLGDKIEKAPHFVANFEELDVQLNDGKTGLQNSIVPVKEGQKQHPWEVDGITGATISSVAIANILDASAQQQLASLHNRLSDFENAGKAAPGGDSVREKKAHE